MKKIFFNLPGLVNTFCNYVGAFTKPVSLKFVIYPGFCHLSGYKPQYTRTIWRIRTSHVILYEQSVMLHVSFTGNADMVQEALGLVCDVEQFMNWTIFF